MTTGWMDVRVATAALSTDLDETNELSKNMEIKESGGDATDDGEGNEE